MSLRWSIPDCFIPEASTGGQQSHESVCVLNETDDDAELIFLALFADSEPRRSAPVNVGARRCRHLRTDVPSDVGDLVLDRGVPYGLVITSNVAVDVQYSRLDTTQTAYTLMSVIPR